MITFDRVKKWLATSLKISEEIITPQCTLGELYRRRPRTIPMENDTETRSPRLDGGTPDSLDAIELIMLFEEEFEIEFPEANAEALAQLWLDETITVQQIVDLVNKNTE